MSSAQPSKTSQEGGPSLWTALRVFLSFTSPRSFLLMIPLLVTLRVQVGDFSGWDLLVIPLILAIQPFAEWLIHVYILHYKPRRVFGRVLDLQVAQFHRAHHRDPWHLADVFIPIRAGWVGFALLSAGWYLVMPTTGLFLSGLLASILMAFTYEWIHYLTHTAYRPRGRWYRMLWRYHRLHHFKNEHYWQGVTMHLGDVVLGTLPDHTKVPTSPTCRTLGVE